jgi:aspartyl-tRNA(Asn)/glutamyl-tRNA(Gln) amidotransferase subunit C
MGISNEDVLHVAKLARLNLDPAEVSSLGEDLAKVLAYVELLSELSLEDVAPTAHVAVTAAPLRPDIVVPSLPPAVALAEAPRSHSGGFAVPAFVEE